MLTIPTPVFGDGIVLCGFLGTGGGAIRLQAKGGGIVTEPLYFEANLPSANGGGESRRLPVRSDGVGFAVLEFRTGQVKWKDRALGAASLCFADGRLYMHGENGEVALVEPSPEGYREQAGSHRPLHLSASIIWRKRGCTRWLPGKALRAGSRLRVVL